MAINAVPVIDLAAFEQGDSTTRVEIARLTDEACRHTGFLAISQHGVNQNVIDTMWNTMQEFFDLHTSVKQQFNVPYPGYPYGYMGNEKETLAASRGNETPPDLKETFNGGPINIPQHISDPEALAFCYAQTPWPTQPAMFTQAWNSYYNAMENLALRIMRLFAEALSLDTHYFDEYISSPISALRALNYPPQQHTPQPGQLRAGAHSDYGSLTILLPQHDSRGLEIQSLDGSWQEVIPVPGAFIINLGDLMERWTNNRWRSTMHRVVNPERAHDPLSRRQSIAYFHQPNWDANVSTIPTCADASTSSQYEPVLSGPYLMSKFNSTI
jgi:isopenicillin N synthase-like dioxygenase